MWEKIKDSAIIVALITGTLSISGSYVTDDTEVQFCKIATEYVMDETKDTQTISNEEWAVINKHYVSVIKNNCKGEKNVRRH